MKAMIRPAALVAALLSLSGVVFASSLPKNSVGSKQIKKGAVANNKIRRAAVGKQKIKNGAVNTYKILDHTILLEDISQSAADALRGQTGPQGERGPPGSGVEPFYGSFYSTSSQFVEALGEATPINYQVAEESNLGVGWSSDSPSIVTIENSGVYNFQFSAQVDKVDGGVDTLFIWLRINGSDVAWSNSSVTLTSNSDRLVPSWNFVFPVSAGDTFEMVMASADPNFRILSEVPVLGPEIPGIILTVARVG